MRVSTNSIFINNVANMMQKQTQLNQVQGQLSTMRRVTVPSDDPVAAAQILDVRQADARVLQFNQNAKSAENSLATSESVLQSGTDVLQRTRELAVKVSNTILSNEDREMTMSEIEGLYKQMVGIANTTDGNGSYVFSGSRSQTKPIAEQSEFGRPVASGSSIVSYNGDSMRQEMQIAGSRQIPVTENGGFVFNKIRDGNGTFKLTNGFPAGYTPVAPNTTAGARPNVDVDQGTVTDAALFATKTDDPAPPAAPIGFKQIEVVFGSEWNHVGAQGSATDPTDFYYDVVVETGAPGPAGFTSLITGKTGATRELASDLYKQQTEQVDPLKNNAVPPTDLAGIPFPTPTGYPKYKPGADIDLTASYGIKLNAKGDTPTSGGVVAINKSQDKSIFDTLNEFGLALLQDVTTPQGMTDFTNKMGNILTHVDATMTRLLSVEARMGSGRREADTLVSVGEGFSLQYKTNLSRLQDLDVAKAASELSLTKTALEASQSTFAQVQKLTLFNYI